LTLTTDALGTVTGYIDVDFGQVSQIRYVKASTGNFADTVDFAITVDGTGEGLWTEANVTASATKAPRQPTHGVDGVASVYAASDAVREKIAIAQDRIKFAVTNGGDTKVGTFHVVLV